MSDSFSFSTFEINPRAIVGNIRLAKKCLMPQTKIVAMVKADAYSIGVENIAPFIVDNVDVFAVANLEEGIKLRGLGIDKEIFVMSPINLDFLSVYSYYNLTPTITSIHELNYLSKEAKMPITVQIKADTGLARFGIVKISEFTKALEKINSNKKISLLGVFSHLATKQNNIEYIYTQKHRFDEFIDIAKTKVSKPLYYHLANTNAIFNHKGFGYNMARMGFGIYGMDNDLHKSLKPAIQIKSKIVFEKIVPPAQSIGYDRTFITTKKTKVGIVPLGYADGVDRRLSNKGFVLINGQKVNIIGRVSMDSFCVDLTDVVGETMGAEVVLLGKSRGEILSLKTLSEMTGASQYETLVKFSHKRMCIKYV